MKIKAKHKNYCDEFTLFDHLSLDLQEFSGKHKVEPTIVHISPSDFEIIATDGYFKLNGSLKFIIDSTVNNGEWRIK